MYKNKSIGLLWHCRFLRLSFAVLLEGLLGTAPFLLHFWCGDAGVRTRAYKSSELSNSCYLTAGLWGF